MSLEIGEREREGIVVLACKGRIVMGDETEALRARTGELSRAGKQNLIFEMSEVGYIDSSGLGELVSLSQNAAKAGGKVKLVGLNQKQMELFVITKLTMQFDIYEDEQAAVNSFFPDRQVHTFDLLDFVQSIKRDDQ